MIATAKATQCKRCGTEGGYRRRDCWKPARYAGTRYGFDGDLCHACFQTVMRAQKSGRAIPAYAPSTQPRTEPQVKAQVEAAIEALRTEAEPVAVVPDELTLTDQVVREYRRAWRRVRDLWRACPIQVGG